MILHDVALAGSRNVSAHSRNMVLDVSTRHVKALLFGMTVRDIQCVCDSGALWDILLYCVLLCCLFICFSPLWAIVV